MMTTGSDEHGDELEGEAVKGQMNPLLLLRINNGWPTMRPTPPSPLRTSIWYVRCVLY